MGSKQSTVKEVYTESLHIDDHIYEHTVTLSQKNGRLIKTHAKSVRFDDNETKFFEEDECEWPYEEDFGEEFDTFTVILQDLIMTFIDKVMKILKLKK